MSGLAPPKQTIEDPGAHELADSSDDHFSDASEGERSNVAPTSPIPITRVERVDDQPAHGEVPGTAAYNIRTQDAVPDEIEVIPDGQRSRSASHLRDDDRPSTPGGTPVPKTVVEKVDPEQPGYGDVPGTAAYEMRTADAKPDEVVTSPIETRQNLEGEHSSKTCQVNVLTAQGEPTADHRSRSPSPSDRQPSSSRPLEGPTEASIQSWEGVTSEPALATTTHEEDGDEDESDGFGDDFDDFEQGAEGQEDDFGDFDEGTEDVPAIATSQRPAPPAPVPDSLAHLPTLNFSNATTTNDILSSIMPYLEDLFPEADVSTLTSLEEAPLAPEPVLSDRSASLWSQLVAPPPLQPPNWIRSRIRRLFLVSLGVPVDLDEILPASKQKKLVLPSLQFIDSPRPSDQLSRIRKENNSSTSVGSNASKGPDGKTKERRKKGGVADRPGPPPPPDFDTNSASLLCSTTEIAMHGFTDEELAAHVKRLEGLVAEASTVLEFWLKRKDSALGDKEAFEGVIENLVGFVKKSKTKR